MFTYLEWRKDQHCEVLSSQTDAEFRMGDLYCFDGEYTFIPTQFSRPDGDEFRLGRDHDKAKAAAEAIIRLRGTW